ncbi:hypothetical protein DFR70_103315 [Nocardia tenerifensis]|uniref:Uncharacterized protein n=1 Tax=Nocardia tenerifensis TaxID=228006 RepID=A0A318K989_9NOCA|nr:hypothetical protein DFR70_103315 [Nocardia tenerifensis]
MAATARRACRPGGRRGHPTGCLPTGIALWLTGFRVRGPTLPGLARMPAGRLRPRRAVRALLGDRALRVVGCYRSVLRGRADGLGTRKLVRRADGCRRARRMIRPGRRSCCRTRPLGRHVTGDIALTGPIRRRRGTGVLRGFVWFPSRGDALRFALRGTLVPARRSDRRVEPCLVRGRRHRRVAERIALGRWRIGQRRAAGRLRRSRARLLGPRPGEPRRRPGGLRRRGTLGRRLRHIRRRVRDGRRRLRRRLRQGRRGRQIGADRLTDGGVVRRGSFRRGAATQRLEGRGRRARVPCGQPLRRCLGT